MDGVCVGMGVGEGALVKTGAGAGAADFVAPNFQTTFLPDLTQVNVLPLKVWILPTFLQRDPALGGFTDHAGEARPKRVKIKNPKSADLVFTAGLYRSSCHYLNSYPI